MAKLKPAKGKQKGQKIRPEGVSCLLLICLGLVFVGLFLYWVMKNANG